MELITRQVIIAVKYAVYSEQHIKMLQNKTFETNFLASDLVFSVITINDDAFVKDRIMESLHK